ncbi:DUF4360 domain-containing protein [Nostoc sp.]|uniref:DUF4360 domain-containing protein n=1 Tax=Nostoc sp. TaxID=1180 RepID=UPI003FA55180
MFKWWDFQFDASEFKCCRFISGTGSTQGFEFQKVPVTLVGNGCPPGKAQGILNGDTLSITFSEFEALASRPKVVSKSCNLRIALNVPSVPNQVCF